MILYVKKKAKPYNGSKEDIYALGVVLFCMLTCTLPYDKPFYLDNNLYLNGDKNYNVLPNDYNDLDENFEILHKYGIKQLINKCY